MKNSLSSCLWLLAGLLVISACRTATEPAAEHLSAVSVVPLPRSAAVEPGTFAVSAQTAIVVEPDDEAVTVAARYLADRLGAAAGTPLSVSREASAQAAGAIVFKTAADPVLGAEAYRLHVAADGVALEAASPAGFFYGAQTVLQLLPAGVFSGKSATAPLTLPCVAIEDAPRLPLARHDARRLAALLSQGVSSSSYIDVLALHKMNTFHWHLTDDQGWRIEIKKYPKLTEVGAWRVDREDQHWNAATPPEARRDGDLRRVLHAGRHPRDRRLRRTSRYITVVPEIEMPGHAHGGPGRLSRAARCTGGPFTVAPGWGMADPGRLSAPATTRRSRSSRTCSTEVIDLFPGAVHPHRRRRGRQGRLEGVPEVPGPDARPRA